MGAFCALRPGNHVLPHPYFLEENGRQHCWKTRLWSDHHEETRQVFTNFRKIRNCFISFRNFCKRIFLERLKITKFWTFWFIFCEILNVGNVILQIFATQKFLGDQFYTLGTKFLSNGYQVLDEVFPKVTKCTFHKYGPSGSIQIHDALCIMALNIVNEKIFVFLWFWYIVLFLCSCSILIWRFFTLIFYKRFMSFNLFIFRNGKLDYWNLKLVLKQCNYHEWLLLKYLAKNMDPLVFKDLFMDISEELEERKPLFMLAESDKGSPTDMTKFDWFCNLYFINKLFL